MEAEVITSFIPELVAAVSDCVPSVSDQCLAKGLIPESSYRKVLELGGTSEEKTRNLILAVKKSTETDSRCFEMFLNILEQTLPYQTKGSLLSAMKKECSDSCRSVVPFATDSQFSDPITSGEVIKLQTSLFGRLEDAIRQHERACAEKMMLEESIKSKEEENMRMKNKLDSLKNHTITDSAINLENIRTTESRISACETEMTKLKQRMEDLESIIDEQGMQVKRGRNVMGLRMMSLMSELTLAAKKEINEVKQVGEKKEAEYLAALRGKEEQQLEILTRNEKKLKEKDMELQSAQRNKQKLEEELRIMVLEHKVSLKDKELALQDKELRIKKLELDYERNVAQGNTRGRKQDKAARLLKNTSPTKPILKKSPAPNDQQRSVKFSTRVEETNFDPSGTGKHSEDHHHHPHNLGRFGCVPLVRHKHRQHSSPSKLAEQRAHNLAAYALNAQFASISHPSTPPQGGPHTEDIHDLSLNSSLHIDTPPSNGCTNTKTHLHSMVMPRALPSATISPNHHGFDSFMQPFTDYGEALTWTSTELNKELEFNEPEPDFCSLTATDYGEYDVLTL